MPDETASADAAQPRSSKRPTIVVAALGVAGLIAGCVVPQIFLYLAGLVTVGVVMARVGAPVVASWWRRRPAEQGRTPVLRCLVGLVLWAVVVALGVLIPAVAGDQITNRDVSWKLDDSDVTSSVTVTGRTYLFTHPPGSDNAIQVVDPATGKRRWKVSETGEAAVGSDGSVVAAVKRPDSGGRDAEEQWRRYTPDGKRRWGPVTIGNRKDFGPVALTKRTTVFGKGCRSDHTGTCRLVGVGVDGTVRWHKTVRNAVVPPSWRAHWQYGPLSESVALRTEDDKKSRLLILDPDTGRQLRGDTMSDQDADNMMITVKNKVAAARTDSNGTWIDLYRGRKRIWSRRVSRVKHLVENYDSSHHVARDRAYVKVGPQIVTIDLSSGAHRTLNAGEKGSYGLPPDNHLGADVIVNRTDGKMTATDAASGHKLWERKIDVASPDALSSDFWVGDAVVVKERTHLPNPVLRPRFRLNRGGRPPLDYTDHSARLTVLDPRTGDEQASAVNRYGKLGLLHVDIDGTDRAVVRHEHGATYRLAKR